MLDDTVELFNHDSSGSSNPRVRETLILSRIQATGFCITVLPGPGPQIAQLCEQSLGRSSRVELPIDHQCQRLFRGSIFSTSCGLRCQQESAGANDRPASPVPRV